MIQINKTFSNVHFNEAKTDREVIFNNSNIKKRESDCIPNV